MVNKYPPYLCGAHVLFDDKGENTSHAKRSGDWVHVQIQPFLGNLASVKKAEERDEQGRYKWWKEFISTAETLKNQGWQQLYKNQYKKEAKPMKVEVNEKFNQRFAQAIGFRL